MRPGLTRRQLREQREELARTNPLMAYPEECIDPDHGCL